LGPLTEIDEMIRKPAFGINLQANPDGECLRDVKALQDDIESALPFGSFRIPGDSLHLSILPIIWARGNYGPNPETLWDSIKEEIKVDLKSDLEGERTFSLEAESLMVFPTAIILRLGPHGQLETIRRAFMATLSKYELPFSMPDITHSTLFRFLKTTPFADIREVVHSVELPAIQWRVNRVVLSHESVYPSL